MTHAACPDCQLRFPAAIAADQAVCPFCFGPIVLGQTAAEVLGYQRYYELRPDPNPAGYQDARP